MPGSPAHLDLTRRRTHARCLSVCSRCRPPAGERCKQRPWVGPGFTRNARVADTGVMSETQANAEVAEASGLTLGGRRLAVLDRARIYACGITPYDVTHLGHAATFVWVDALARTLRLLGVEPEVCRNVTDVDDVLDEAARRAGEPYDAFAAVQQYYFDRDMATLSVRPVAHDPGRADTSTRSSAWPAACWRPARPTRATAACTSAASLRCAGQGWTWAWRCACRRSTAAGRMTPPRMTRWTWRSGRPASRPSGVGVAVGAGPAGLARGVRGYGPVGFRCRG